MLIQRRGFLKTGALTAVSASLAIGGTKLALGQRPGTPRGSALPRKAEESPLISFNSETFKPYVGDIFQAPNTRGKMVSLTLLDVVEYKPKPSTKLSVRAAQELQSFSLHFRAQEKLPQLTSIHKISHPALGEFDLFLTSREQDDGTIIYEAVFSHF